jgi:hypothetical protein
VVLNKMGIIFFFGLLKMIDHLCMGFAGGFLEFGEDFCSIKLKEICFASLIVYLTHICFEMVCVCVLCVNNTRASMWVMHMLWSLEICCL